MKTLRVSDTVHRELTRLLGEMMAQTEKNNKNNLDFEGIDLSGLSEIFHLSVESLGCIEQ
jgi:hypothetical protein